MSSQLHRAKRDQSGSSKDEKQPITSNEAITFPLKLSPRIGVKQISALKDPHDEGFKAVSLASSSN